MSNPHNTVPDRNGDLLKAGDRAVIEVAKHFVTCTVIDVVPATADGWSATATLLLPDGQKLITAARSCARVTRQLNRRAA